MEQIKRQTAGKFWISDLLNINNSLEVKGKNAFRVNIVGNVVFKFISEDGNYASLTIDDGSGSIRIKVWGEDSLSIKDREVGELVVCIGKIRSYNEEVYINPEIIKKINLNWELVRKIELLKEYGKPLIISIEDSALGFNKENFEEGSDEKTISENERQKILNLIEKKSGDVGARYDDIIKEGGEKAEEIVKELIREGEVYEPRPNMLRVLD